MQINITPETIANWIGEILRITPRVEGDDIEFNLTPQFERNQRLGRLPGKNTKPNLIRKIGVAKLHSILEMLRKKEEYQDSGIFDKYSYEILVTEETPLTFGRLRGENFILEDKENEIVYTLSVPSDSYIVLKC